MTLNIRDLTRHIWMSVNGHDSKSVIEKKSAINLLVAFAVATKHYLREEYSYEFLDLKHLISHLPVFHTPSSNVPMSYQHQSEDAGGISDCNLAFVEHRRRKHSCVKDPLKARDVVTPTNIPIELSYYIASYINSCREQDKCDEATYTLMQTGNQMSCRC
jgi:putative membrane protein